jgi:hypothetical protein
MSDDYVSGFEAAKARFAGSLRARAKDAGEEAYDMAKRQNFQGMASMERMEEFLLECATEVEAMDPSPQAKG